jgi:hypothetical protein
MSAADVIKNPGQESPDQGNVARILPGIGLESGQHVDGKADFMRFYISRETIEYILLMLDETMGFEPMNNGFAVRRMDPPGYVSPSGHLPSRSCSATRSLSENPRCIIYMINV